MSGGIPRKPRGVPSKRELVELAKAARHNASPEALDLVHVTSVGWGRRIVAAGRIETRPCSVFNKRLVYAFVARPAYRFKDGDSKHHQMSRFPFVFAISPRALPTPFHVYPFDTGACLAGIYGEVADPTIYLEEYELTPCIEAALDHIAWAFGTKTAYFEGTLISGLAETFPAWRTAGRGWIDIANLVGTGRDQPDARASAIEVAYDQSIDLGQGHVTLAIFPQQLLEDARGDNTEFLTDIRKLGFSTKAYDWRPNETPDSFMDEIAGIVRRHLEESGQL
jgi:hypothetical protein